MSRSKIKISYAFQGGTIFNDVLSDVLNLSTQFVQKGALEDCNIDFKFDHANFLGFLLWKRTKIHHYTADAVNFVKIIVNLKNWSSSQQVTGKQRVSNIYTLAGLL